MISNAVNHFDMFVTSLNALRVYNYFDDLTKLFLINLYLTKFLDIWIKSSFPYIITLCMFSFVHNRETFESIFKLVLKIILGLII